MRLVVKKSQKTISELTFNGGTVHIGRIDANQVCLPDRAVSKNHAIIYDSGSQRWMIEDLDSANKTYLNGHAIHQAQIRTGDVIRISDFDIEVDLDYSAPPDSQDEEEELEMIEVTPKQPEAGESEAEETIVAKTAEDEDKDKDKDKKVVKRTIYEAQIIARKPGAEKPSPIRFPGERAEDFLNATDQISKSADVDEVLLALRDIVMKQFGAYHCWCALRNQPAGAMTTHAGTDKNGNPIDIGDLQLEDKITEAVENGEFLLFVFSRLEEQNDRTTVRSVLMAPVVSPAGCFGVVYVSNTFIDDHYNLGDLDYLMMLVMHAATVLERL